MSDSRNAYQYSHLGPIDSAIMKQLFPRAVELGMPSEPVPAPEQVTRYLGDATLFGADAARQRLLASQARQVAPAQALPDSIDN